jgi:hypothetical protein
MNVPVPRPLPSQPALALWWASFHARRMLQRPATLLWLLGGVGFLVLPRLLGAASAEATAGATLALLPFFAMFFGTGGLRQEVEDQTLTYAFVRPLGRGYIWIAHVLAATCVVAIPIAAGSLAGGGDVLGILRTLSAALLGALAYTAVFGVFALLMRRPTLVGLVFVLGWEQVVGSVPGFLSRLTLLAHVRGLAHVSLQEGVFANWYTAPPWWASLSVLVGVTAVAFAFGSLWVSRRELVVPK